MQLLDDDRLCGDVGRACVPLSLVPLEDVHDCVSERLDEHGELVAREDERVLEELEALDNLGPLLLQVLRLVLELLHALLAR